MAEAVAVLPWRWWKARQQGSGDSVEAGIAWWQRWQGQRGGGCQLDSAASLAAALRQEARWRCCQQQLASSAMAAAAAAGSSLAARWQRIGSVLVAGMAGAVPATAMLLLRAAAMATKSPAATAMVWAQLDNNKQ